MRILGLNSPVSLPPAIPGGQEHHLNDGSAALLDNGSVVFAAIEERHSRVRYSSGFKQTLAAAWTSYSSRLSAVDAVAFSSCCGPVWSGDAHRYYVRQLLKAALPEARTPSRVIFVGHHASHASLGFMLSGFDEALVAVVDGFGNLIDDTGWNHENWWLGQFERHSYYRCYRLADGRFSMQLIARDADGADEIGLGELYGSLTHFCGYTSYQHAGTVMALSAFGRPVEQSNTRIVQLSGSKLAIPIANNHPRKAEMLADYIADAGYGHFAAQHKPVGSTQTSYCDIVASVQSQLEEGLVSRLTTLAEQHGLQNIVVSGGVALNCLAMGRLARSFGGSVFVPPAPGDTGQALGNAIWAGYCTESPLSDSLKQRFQPTDEPLWGIPASDKSVKETLEYVRTVEGIRVIEVKSRRHQAQIAAEALAEGKLVATCLGRSEYGPRALGARSILADPRDRSMVEKVNRFKQREPFRPFAPAIMEEHVLEYFQAKVDSPFMSFALPLRAEQRDRVAAVAHADGTARLQTVAHDSPSPLRLILEEFDKLTGVPVLLNTSFNRKGEAMVESAELAAGVFLNSQIDMLLLDGYVIVQSPV